jgi:hypothetical protein
MCNLQVVMNMSMADWSKMVENLKLSEPMIPPIGPGSSGEESGKKPRIS